MTFSAGSIAGHHMMHEMDVVTKVAGKLLEMQHSQYFDRSSVLRRPLKVGLILAQTANVSRFEAIGKISSRHMR